MKFNSHAVKGNIVRQNAGDNPIPTIWVAQAWMHSVPHEPKSEKIWQTLFTADKPKHILQTARDMRRFNKGFKIRVCIFVMIPENSKMEEFREF